jgi:hypothetical protein
VFSVSETGGAPLVSTQGADSREFLFEARERVGLGVVDSSPGQVLMRLIGEIMQERGKRGASLIGLDAANGAAQVAALGEVVVVLGKRVTPLGERVTLTGTWLTDGRRARKARVALTNMDGFAIRVGACAGTYVSVGRAAGMSGADWATRRVKADARKDGIRVGREDPSSPFATMTGISAARLARR